MAKSERYDQLASQVAALEKDRDELAARLDHAQQMAAMGVLAGGIAHDLKNMLFSLVGFGEILREDLPADSPLQDIVDGILRAALRAQELVQQIRSPSSKANNEPWPIHIQYIVREVAKLIRADMPPSISMTQRIAPDCAPVTANLAQIYQIVMTLATNSVHAMKKTGGTLKVTLEDIQGDKEAALFPGSAPGRYVTLSFSDNGAATPGQIPGTADKGAGLELSVIGCIVGQHGGGLSIRSTPGRGTERRIYLPAVGTEA